MQERVICWCDRPTHDFHFPFGELVQSQGLAGDLNDSGLTVLVTLTSGRSVLLTGDADYAHLMHAQVKNLDHLVATHHGARFNAGVASVPTPMSALVQYFLVQVLVYAFLAFYVSLIQQTIDTLNGVANSKSATWATIGPVMLLAIIGILLLSQINNMAAAIAGGVPIFAPRIGAVLASASGYRLSAAANRARLAFRNPLSPTSMSRREELASRQRARVGLRAASWAQSADSAPGRSATESRHATGAEWGGRP